MSDEEIILKLRTLGFTKYEARVYLALLRYGTLTSTELVKVAKIPQARLYDVIERLASKGLIKVSKTRPTQYSIIEPKVALRKMVEMDIAAKNKLIEDLISSVTTPERATETGEVWILKGWQSVYSAIEELLSTTQDELLISTYSTILEKIIGHVKKIVENGGSVCLILYDKYENLIDHLVHIDEVRFKPTLAPTILISDSTRAILIPRLVEKRSIGYAIDDPELLSPINGYFFHLREASELLIYTPLTNGSLRRFRNLERAIEAILKAQERGLSVIVEAQGKWVKTGKQDVVKGKPVNYIRERFREIVTLVLETESGDKISIGGKGSTIEDFEALRITIRGLK